MRDRVIELDIGKAAKSKALLPQELGVIFVNRVGPDSEARVGFERCNVAVLAIDASDPLKVGTGDTPNRSSRALGKILSIRRWIDYRFSIRIEGFEGGDLFCSQMSCQRPHD